MPDGKPYRGMRGGNWYNGYDTLGLNDGHSRVEPQSFVLSWPPGPEPSLVPCWIQGGEEVFYGDRDQ